MRRRKKSANTKCKWQKEGLEQQGKEDKDEGEEEKEED